MKNTQSFLSHITEQPTHNEQAPGIAFHEWQYDTHERAPWLNDASDTQADEQQSKLQSCNGLILTKCMYRNEIKMRSWQNKCHPKKMC